MASSLVASIRMEFILLFFLLPFTSSDFTPTTTYFLNCGSSSNAVNGSRTFKPDDSYLSSTSTSTTSTSPSSNSLQLYSTVRVFTSETTYNFKTSSSSTYILRLHFHAFSASLASARFSVSALDRYLLLSNFSASKSLTILKEYLLWVDTDHVTLTFTPDGGNTAFISAIELFNAPDDLITTASPTYLDGLQVSDIGHHAMETLYRVNVGGPEVDDGDLLWRSWSTDVAYIFKDSAAFDNTTTVKINYPNYGPEIAPQIVYQSLRSMAITDDMRTNTVDFNITWNFPVPNDYTYLIRMHFCNFISATSADLLFDVYLGDNFASQDLQPSQHTANIAAAAFYVDFASNPTSPNLSVSIGPSSQSRPDTANAILNGLEIMKLSNSGNSLDGESFIASPKEHKKKMAIPIISIISSLFLIAIIIVATLLLLCRRRRQMPKSKTSSMSWAPFSGSTSTGRTNPSGSPRLGNLGLHIPFSEIKIATKNFDSNLIVGRGGFGNVYKGVLRDGTIVAVKRGMPESKQGYPEFQTEIITLSTIRHRHLVSLIGYCEEQSEMILVYEYMERGTLNSCLLDTSSPNLSWKQRLQICIGAARGLHYLHTGHSHNIIHRDVKSTNILLDENYLAKVSDFGLSRVGPNIEQTHVSTVVKGTFGYLDPDYFKTQKLTDKSDVFSFGVTLFEVLCGRAVIDQTLERERINLAEWAMMWQKRGKIEKIVDRRIVTEINANSLRTFGETAVKCLAQYPTDRPSIGDVLWYLEYALQLQETEVRREPHEDSGDVDVGIHTVPITRVPMTRLPSTMGVGENHDDEDDAVEESWKPDEMGTSDVFSQLVTDEGR